MMQKIPKNTLIDNSSEALSMQAYFKRLIQVEGVDKIQIATGYWDIPGMALVIDELSRFLDREGTSCELLIGKDPYVYTSLLAKPKYKDANYPRDFIRTDIYNLELKDEYKDVVRLLIKHGDSGKLQIRIYSRNSDKEVEFLHSKCYIFSGQSLSFGIIGSSNFTQKGLQGNSELNYLEADEARVTAEPKYGSSAKGHIYWFKEKWALSQEWTKEFLEQIIRKSPIYIDIKEEQLSAEFTPYEQYIKLLQLRFGDVVDIKLGQEIKSYLPSHMLQLDYQIEAVKRCFSIMHEHGGFMLADVVGLGKTVVGTLIIKHFLSVPEDDGRARKVLVISPPAIQSSWKKTVKLFDQDTDQKMAPKIDFITTGRIGSIADEDVWGDEDDDNDIRDTGDFTSELQKKHYGLIIIDESHKFRNSNTLMYKSLDDLIGTIGLEKGTYPYVGLLSATPQNNRPNDLKNQIYLFQRNHNESTLKKAEGGNIESFFSKISKEYNALITPPRNLFDGSVFNNSIPKEERRQKLDAISKKLRECILIDILERRTRTDVEKYYKEDMQRQGLVFPKIIGPNSLKYIMDDDLAQLFSDTMSIIVPTEEEKSQSDNWLKYYRYRAIEYFVDPCNKEKHKGRGNRDVSSVTRQLATIMQMLLVKRLESSFTAFTQSLLNLRRYTENMIKMWEQDVIFICPQIDINNELDNETKSKNRKRKVTFEECIEEIRTKIEKLNREGRNEKGQNAEYKREEFKPEYYDLLKKDHELIAHLYDRWSMNSEDPKLDAFKESFTSKLLDPKKNTSGKVVIFSEAIDTVKALTRWVKAKGYKVLSITATNRNDMEQTIAENFDANYEGEWKNDYDVIITTEVLAEGVNLHRANVILNYDTPWNSTRLMQRIGRVNRIGSKEPFIYVYNFMPSAQGDAQIQLVRKAYTKLQSFHVLFGEDSKIFSEEESVVHYDTPQMIKDEESPLQKYVFELKQYKQAHPERYLQIEQAKDQWQIAHAMSGTAYFLVEAPRSTRLAIKIAPEADNQEPEIISQSDLLKEMKVDENAKRVDLPENWEKLSQEALLTYNQHFIRINKSKADDKRTKATGVIVDLYQSDHISEKSKRLLKSAGWLVRKGNSEIINKMLDIQKELGEREARLFKIGQQEIDDILEREIGKLVAGVEGRQGKAKIVLGTIK